MGWTPFRKDKAAPPPPPQLPTGPALRPRSPSELLVPTRPPQAPRSIKMAREPRRMNPVLRFFNGVLSFVFVVLIVGAAAAIALRTSFEAPGPLDHTAIAVIPKGEGYSEIATRLEREGIVSDRRLFVMQYLVARLYNGGGSEKATLKAGEYEIRKNASVRQVLDTLVEGKAIQLKFTVPEGLTSQQIVDRLKADQNLVGDVAEVPPEGSLLPDTYRYARGMSRQELITRMQAEQRRLVTQAWDRRQQQLPFATPEQALIMASIIEKETGRADERDRVAAVFVNRLRKNMRLQSDPTIVYGIVGGQGPLGRGITRAEIETPTPYNTYRINGLPPGPICNPGRAAIEATLNPAKTQDLYFVADGTGGHTFSATLKDHNAAVQTWRKIEREARAARGEPPPPEPEPEPEAAAGSAPAAEAAPVPKKAPAKGGAGSVKSGGAPAKKAQAPAAATAPGASPAPAPTKK